MKTMALFERWKGQPDSPIHQELEQLYRITVQELVRNPNELHQFLRFSGQLYKYDMDSLLAIYAQAPNAKFIADFDTWKRVGRSVTLGSKAIKILRQKETGAFYHENVFDVSQTTGKDVPFPDWLLSKETFTETMTKWASMREDERLADEHNPYKLLTEAIKGAIHEQINGIDLGIAEDLAAVSNYVLLSKLGQAPSFSGIKESVQRLFENEALLIEHYPQLLTVNRITLAGIRQAKKELLVEKETENERIRETKRLRETERQGRGNDTENRATRQTNIQRGTRRSDVSRNQRTEEQSHLIANGATHTTIPDDVSTKPIQRTPTNARVDDGSSSDGSQVSQPSGKELRDAQSEREAEGATKGTREATELPKNTGDGISEQSTISDQLEPQKEKITTHEIERTLIKHGTGIQEGKYKIMDFFQKEPNALKRRSFVKEAFGIGGASGYGNGTVAIRYNHEGIQFFKYNTAPPIEIKKTWAEVSTLIRKLIETDQYLNEEEKKAYTHYIQEKETVQKPLTTEQEKETVLSDAEVAWIELPETYRYQRLFEKAYLVNEKGEMEREAVEILLEDGKTYYRPFNKPAAPVGENAEKNQSESEELDLFAFDFGTKQALFETKEQKVKEKTFVEQEERTAIEFSFPEETTNFYSDTPKQKLADNLAALRLLKTLEQENRLATSDEQKILAKYVGWGGLADVFDETKSNFSQERKELETLLTEEEYASARESVLTAYYTDPLIIKEIYRSLKRFGFSSGRILDPAMGTGNFFAAMPSEMREQSELYGVEIDSLSARLSKQLHQKTVIQEKGFEETLFTENSLDVVVANVPFADIRLTDNKTLKKYYIHDYFIKRSIDLVHEGGIVAVITSSGTMDKKDASFRKELSHKADLIGGVRLPNTAFKQIAGTEVTTDVLFFRKHSGIQEQAEEQLLERRQALWVETTNVPSGITREDGSVQPPMTMNNYFHKHMLTHTLGRYHFKNYRGGTYTLNPREEKPWQTELPKVLNTMDGQFLSAKTMKLSLPEVLPTVEEQKEAPIDSNIPKFSFGEKNGEIYYHGLDGVKKQELKSTQKKRLQQMIQLRDLVSEVIDYQQDLDFESSIFEEKLHRLNESYNKFERKYGYLNNSTNTRLFYEDDRFALLMSIEVPQKDGSYTKSAIFREATIRPIEPVISVHSALEALNHSLAKQGKVDIPYMTKLYNVPETQLLEELKGHIFVDVEKYIENDEKLANSYVTKEAFLSGDVKKKLTLSKALAKKNSLFEENVKALKPVIPKDLGIEDISYELGASWLPLEIYHDFMEERFQLPPFYINNQQVAIEYNEFTDTYHVKGKSAHRSILVTNEYGTERANAYQLLEKSLNFKTISVYDQVEKDVNGERKKVSVLNVDETMLARTKQDRLKKEFKLWVFSDPKRAQKLLSIYNERFNRIRPRTYNGEHLLFEGLNQQFTLRPHQKNVVARIVETGRALMAHEVGAGKTASMIAAGMMMKDQGLIKKPMYCVPNHLTEQFGQELLRFYPSKKVLITTKKDFEKKNRQKFISRIATGEYDAVIIGHSQMEKIPLSKERRESLIKRELSEVRQGIKESKAQAGESWSLKQMVSFEKRLKEKLEALQNEEYKDHLLTFEELGVDFLFVDEAHAYKNLYTYTKMSNVAGVNTSNSLRASDMYMKCQYLLEKNHGRGVVFATGTPISNSISELYTLQRFLQPDELARMRLTTFDRWASTFGEVVSAPEINPEGTSFRMKNRFAKFHNLPELMRSFQLVADIQTSEQLALPVPAIQTGKPQLIVSDPSPYQEEKMIELGERADAIRQKSVEPHEDNMLKITHEAKLMAIDPRLLDPTVPAYPEGKLFRCVDNVYRIWKTSDLQHSTQIIFSDSGTPKPNQFNVYDEVKQLLIIKGIPEKEIAFIHSAKNDRQREELFEKVRQGEIRILLGSTEKLGTGTNIQDKLLAVHHVDVPWRPSDLTQRDGRIVRQGNENKEVQIYRYVAKNSFDSFLWQTQENKLKFINQIMTNKSIARSAEDIDQTMMSAAEAKSIATNNPLLLEKLTLDKKVMEYQLLQSSWQSSRISLLEKVETRYPKRLEEIRQTLELYEEDRQLVAEELNKEFSIELQGTIYTEKKEALDVFNQLLPAPTDGTQKKEIGRYRGLALSVAPSQLGQVIVLLDGKATHKAAVERNGTGSFIRLDNVLKAIPETINDLKNEQADIQLNVRQAKEQLEKPFEHEDELKVLLQRQTTLNLSIEMGEATLPETEKSVVAPVLVKPKQLEDSQLQQETHNLSH
ncbi:N-6 DNA methylase [Enterococcus faecalis]|nr:N-6 DNA methylase [Enterococcus faecalis]